MDYIKLAEMLFPDVKHDMQYYLEKYPSRNLPDGAEVTRLGPSPTGYLHIGHLYSALIDSITAKKSGGVFYLRLEDTDQKRYIKGAGDVAYDMLVHYGVVPDEGYRGDDRTQQGNYGDYVQSHRLPIYHAFAKELVKRGCAYPCFCQKSENKEDILERREKQLAETDTITEHDKCRDLSMAQIEENLRQNKPWALRLYSKGDPQVTHEFVDKIKGKRTIRENAKDIVLIKSDKIPPYALAHVVDDTLMHTTTVVRGEEWYPSVSAHLEIFKALGLKPPKYAHTPVISKLDGGNKRKLSKRKDPEADVRFYIEKGYPTQSVIEYVLNLLNSDFEIWREKNPLASLDQFDFSIKKIGSNNPMFDFDKLNSISKNVISKLSATEIFDNIYAWAKTYDQPFSKILQNNKDKYLQAIDIDRTGARPRKDIYAWSMVKELFSYICDQTFVPLGEYDEKYCQKDYLMFLDDYISSFKLFADKQLWFDHIKQIALKHNFAENKEYKQNPQAYAGNIADACNLIRLAVTAKNNTPDLCSIMNILGSAEVIKRLKTAQKVLKNG